MAVKVNREKCLTCVGCVGVCPQNSLDYIGKRILADENCNECGICVKFCPVGALSIPKEESQ
jgi:NAD-dependent dihydropyrimidine dehydrogenase PreA subunit